MMVSDLKAEFLYRIISFSLSGTCLVDLHRTTHDHANCSAQAKMACALSNRHLARLLTNQIMSRRKTIFFDTDSPGSNKKAQKSDSSVYHEGGVTGGKKVLLSDSFQEVMHIKMFGLSVS